MVHSRAPLVGLGADGDRPRRQPVRPLRPSVVPMSDRRYRGFVHITDEDTTSTRIPSAEQNRAIGLLELATPGCGLVRLSEAQWSYVDRVVAALNRLGVPPPRTAPDDRAPTNGASA